jgi:hypothetical protein
VSAFDTKSNLDNFNEAGVLDEQRKNRVFFVSSTCHLLRVARLSNEVFKARAHPPERLVLIGAEHYLKSLPAPSRYIKTMMHEVFSHVMMRDGVEEG